MLLKSKISKIKILSQEWFDTRNGKFTSSENSCLCSDTFLTTGCKSYIYRKAGEILTGKSAKGDEIDTDSMRWGAQHEASAVRKFAKKMGFEFVVCQQLITEPDSRYGSTPDGIIPIRESLDETQYEVETVEVKCPPTYTHYVKLALCETPQDVKKVNPEYYWQVLDQMLMCDSLKGYFIVYHPEFKKGNMRIIEFRKMEKVGNEYPLVKDLAFLKERKSMAVDELDRVVERLSALGYVA